MAAERLQACFASPRSEASETFGSRVDLWLVLLLLSALGAVFYEALFGPAQLVMGLAAAMVVVMCLCIVPCRYTLNADRLRVRCGLWHWDIPYADIKSVRETHDLAYAPALSLHRRLEIRYGRESLLVSPRRHDRFVDALYERMYRLQGARRAEKSAAQE